MRNSRDADGTLGYNSNIGGLFLAIRKILRTTTLRNI